MQIGILGPLTASDDSGQSLAVSGVLVRAMLAMLALEPGKPLAAERLVDGLWGDDPPARTPNALATLAKRLRAGLGDTGVIAARAPGYALLIDPDAVDATRFARLAESGRQTEALALYERTRSLLPEELGVDPSAQLREAQLAVLRGEAPPAAKPTAKTAAKTPAKRGNLRRLVTPILGRDEEIARLTVLLTDEPLVTIVGPGGAGKTRLALECAARLADRWTDGGPGAGLGGTCPRPARAGADGGAAVAHQRPAGLDRPARRRGRQRGGRAALGRGLRRDRARPVLVRVAVLVLVAARAARSGRQAGTSRTG